MFIYYNPNPKGRQVGDCTIRAISKAMGKSWDDTYLGTAMTGYDLCNMADGNDVWGTYLRRNGFVRHTIPNTCPECYTVKDFCEEHPIGTYILALDGHVVTAIDGNVYDTFDSTNEIVIFYFEKENTK